MIENITYDDHIVAIILRATYNEQGIKFFTPDDHSQQLAYMNRPQDYIIQPHIHNPFERTIQLTQEVLFIKSGKVRADFYDDKKNYLESRILNQGDVILLSFGGHGFEMIEPSEIIEVKQGPYAGDMDKIRFSGITAQEAKIIESQSGQK